MATHLNVRSFYSLLNGTMSIPELVDTALSRGFKSVALTDFHTLHGALDFQIEATQKGLQPIFGLEVSIQEAEQIYTSLVLARDNTGFQALIKLSEILDTDKVVSLTDISEVHQHLIFIVYSEGGPFEPLMLQKDWEACTQKLQAIQALVPEFYLGISHQESEFFKDRNQELARLAAVCGIATVALSKVYYKDKADEMSLKILNAIDKQTYLEDRNLTSSPNRHFLSISELEKLYDAKQLELSDKIAAMCQVDLLQLKTELPVFDAPNQVESAQYLRSLSLFGLKRRFDNKVTGVYIERLNYELDVITSMNFSDYFLIVYDVIRFAKQSQIYVGPGRGSAAGSLVAYSLGITEVDPLKYDLLFERFLNPERATMPDIDIDFPDNRRQEVIEYVREKYGDDHVAHIITFGTLKARQAFRDTARVLQIPLHKVDQCSKLINAFEPLEVSYTTQPRFKTLLKSDETLYQCYEYARTIEGIPRHASLHAAGIVLSKVPLDAVCPIQHFEDGESVIQYDMTHLEKVGLIKIDFLGLRNLTLIDGISSDIRKTQPNFNIMAIPLDDKKTYQSLSRGETVGIFQLESEGMTKLLKDLKPYQFNDIVDTIALYRPGPMENIGVYLKSRQNSQSIHYLHEDLKSITESTYGILIYQEQIMMVAQKMAGFSLAKADILRKAMSKKDEQELFTLKDEFIAGCIEQGYRRDLAQELFDLIFKFANYGFNKSHSVAYGLVAYQLAYLKANYGPLFYVHLLSSVIGSDAKTRVYLDECKRRGIAVLGLHLEHSQEDYRLEGEKIRLPFTIIKGISITISRLICEEVLENGPYASFYDAIARLVLVKLKRVHFEALIQAGAFDYFSLERLSMLASLEEAMRYASLIQVKKEDTILLNKDLISEPIFTSVPDNKRQNLNNEVRVLGFYFSEHPLVHYRNNISSLTLAELTIQPTSVLVLASIERIKKHRAKNGKMMAFLKVSDETTTLDAVVFATVYEKLTVELQVGMLVQMRVTMKEAGSLIVQELEVLETEALKEDEVIE